MAKFICKKTVRNYVKEQGKQASKEFLEALNFKVQRIIMGAIANSKSFKRLKGGELLV